jgi:hypothetical protein
MGVRRMLHQLGRDQQPPPSTAGMLDCDVLPPGLTPITAGANLLPWKGSVGRVGDALARPLVEVTS